jgi:hypothetical protein
MLRFNVDKASELKYKELPGLQKKYEELEQKRNR